MFAGFAAAADRRERSRAQQGEGAKAQSAEDPIGKEETERRQQMSYLKEGKSRHEVRVASPYCTSLTSHAFKRQIVSPPPQRWSEEG
jgi:hypothetical protein